MIKYSEENVVDYSQGLERIMVIDFLLSLSSQRSVDTDRPLQIDPYYGSYGLTGYVFTIQGTPTHGTAIVDLERSIMWFLPVNGRRTMKSIHAEVMHRQGRMDQMLWDMMIKILEICDLPTHHGAESHRVCLDIHIEKEKKKN